MAPGLKCSLTINTLPVSGTAGEQHMKPINAGKTPSRGAPKHPKPDGGDQQAIAEKAANSPASVKARVDSTNMPDKPPLHHQHMPNSSGRK